MSGLLGALLVWLPLDTWTVVVAALAASACAVLGVFLVLRKMSMMGDAISHAVLPGLAAAFLLTGTRDSVVMLIGAALVGVLTAALTESIRRAGRVDEGAAMGVTFTILFALGLILIRQSADHVDLDPDCVLYGAIEYAVLDQVSLLGLVVPRAAAVLGGVLLVNLLVVGVLYKELKLAAFDPALATTLGFSAKGLHYLLMTLVAVTTVAAFESVGSILVIAMLIVPPAAAHLLTDRLSVLLVLSVVIAVASATGGHLTAIAAPAWFGFEGVSTSTAGMMGVVAGGLFLVALLVGPRHGLLSKLAHRLALSLRIVREDVLGLLYRLDEARRPAPAATVAALLQQGGGPPGWLTQAALRRLSRQGLVERAAGALRLTTAGRDAGRDLVRSHRLWETYLEQCLAVPAERLHGAAERLEHVTDAELQARLARSVGDAPRDPHGTTIPGRE